MILKKISKIGATRCQILRLKCTKFNFCLAVFKRPTSKGREGKERGEREGEGRRGEVRGQLPPSQLGSLDPPVPLSSLL